MVYLCSAKQGVIHFGLSRSGIERALEVKLGIRKAIGDLAGCLYFDGLMLLKIDIQGVLYLSLS